MNDENKSIRLPDTQSFSTEVMGVIAGEGIGLVVFLGSLPTLPTNHSFSALLSADEAFEWVDNLKEALTDKYNELWLRREESRPAEEASE